MKIASCSILRDGLAPINSSFSQRTTISATHPSYNSENSRKNSKRPTIASTPFIGNRSAPFSPRSPPRRQRNMSSHPLPHSQGRTKHFIFDTTVISSVVADDDAPMTQDEITKACDALEQELVLEELRMGISILSISPQCTYIVPISSSSLDSNSQCGAMPCVSSSLSTLYANQRSVAALGAHHQYANMQMSTEYRVIDVPRAAAHEKENLLRQGEAEAEGGASHQDHDQEQQEFRRRRGRRGGRRVQARRAAAAARLAAAAATTTGDRHTSSSLLYFFG